MLPHGGKDATSSLTYIFVYRLFFPFKSSQLLFIQMIKILGHVNIEEINPEIIIRFIETEYLF